MTEKLNDEVTGINSLLIAVHIYEPASISSTSTRFRELVVTLPFIDTLGGGNKKDSPSLSTADQVILTAPSSEIAGQLRVTLEPAMTP